MVAGDLLGWHCNVELALGEAVQLFQKQVEDVESVCARKLRAAMGYHEPER